MADAPVPDAPVPGAPGAAGVDARYEALIRVSEALRRYHDRDTLFRSLARELRPVVRFDVLGLALLDPATGTVVPHVLEGSGMQAAPPRLTGDAQLTHWVLASQAPLVIPEIALEPRFADEMAYLATHGIQSVCCLPLTTPQHQVGMLLAASRSPREYGDGDVAFLSFAANQVALAIDDAQNHDALQAALALERERFRNLTASDELLRALSGVLDVREVFNQVSSIVQPLVPHDMAALMVVSPDRTTITAHAVSGRGVVPSSSAPLPPWFRAWIDGGEDVAIYPNVQDDPRTRDGLTSRAGMKAALRVAVRDAQEMVGLLEFSALAADAYDRAHALIGLRVAGHVALALSHERLAEQRRRVEALRSREAALPLLDQVLASVTEAGKLPDVWDRLSGVVQSVLPHDALLLSALLPDGVRGRVYASVAPGSARFSEIVHVPPMVLQQPDWDHDVVGDLQARDDQKHLESTKLGYRAVIRVPLRLDGEYVAAISILSFTPHAYGPDDLVTAKHVAARVLQNFARERRESLRRKADEATERVSRLEARVRMLTEELDARTGFRRVVGDSPEWSRVLRQATQVAGTDTTVLLLGESGTGKEVVARFIHRASTRADGPFVALNCAALPEQLLESELFGHERGAFTGAIASKPGHIEQAAGGVLFLDEVSEMPPAAQAKFLRVLQEREFQRVGGTRPLKANIRVIAATNRDLPAMIARGQFREDLYYRLHVFEIGLPPLRERTDDILPLSEAFLHEIGQSFGRPPAGVSREANEILMAHDWPGNVRQLRNALERAAILCEGGLITGEHLSLPPRRTATVIAVAGPPEVASVAVETTPADPAPPTPALPPAVGDLASMERTAIEQALRETRFNKAKAARLLGLTRTQLYVRLRKYGLE